MLGESPKSSSFKVQTLGKSQSISATHGGSGIAIVEHLRSIVCRGEVEIHAKCWEIGCSKPPHWDDCFS
jgi:hypothetical protein